MKNCYFSIKTALFLIFLGVGFALNAQVYCEDIVGFDCSSCPNYSTAANPDVTASCESGTNIILLIDESNSIWNLGLEQDVEDGVNAFLQELECSYVNIAIIEFGSVANFIVSDYTPVGDVILGMQNYFNGFPFNGQVYSPNVFNGLGATNWQASFLQASTLPTADIVLMITDGVPTAYTPDALNPETSFDFCGSGNSTQQAEIYNTVQIANVIKNQGSHIFVLGVGAVDTQFIQDISGEEAYTLGETITSADYFIDEGLDSFAESIASLANGLCPIVTSVTSNNTCEGEAEGSISIMLSNNALAPFTLTINGNLELITGEYEINLENLEPGLYDIEIEGDGTCYGPWIDSIDILELSLPKLNVQDISICEGGKPFIDLSALVTSNGQVTFHATQEDANLGINALQDLTVIVTSTTSFYVRSESEDGCFVTGIVTITVLTQPVCHVDVVHIDCNSPEEGVELFVGTDAQNPTFSWSTIDGNIVSGAETANPIVDEAGVYTVTITDLDTGCSISCNTEVTKDTELPEVHIEPIGNLCIGHDPIQLVGMPTGGVFSGDNVTEAGVFASSGSGTYSVTYTYTNEENGCENSETISISVAPFPSCSVCDAIINCNSLNGAVQLTAITDVEKAIYNWTTSNGNIVSGADTATPFVDSAGIYEVTITDSNSGCSSTCQAEVTTDLEHPTVTLEPVQDLCLGHESIQLQGLPLGGTFSGDNVSEDGVFTSSSTGSFLITYTYVNPENGCEGSDSITIDVVDCCTDETAFAYNNDLSTCFLDVEEITSNRWGWFNGPLTFGDDYWFQLYAGAGQCNLNSGELVGEVSISYNGSGDMIITYNLSEGQLPTFYQLGTVHVYIGCEQYPESLAPGQMPYHASPDTETSVEIIIANQDIEAFGCSQFYFIAHAEVSVCNPGVTLGLDTHAATSNEAHVSVYPMPFQNEITVKYKFNYATDVTLQLVDMQGRLITTYSKETYPTGTMAKRELQIPNVNQQLLFLRIITSKGVTIKKLISKN